MSDTATSSEDVYHPEWLGFEAALGFRPTLSGNTDIDVPIFNQQGMDLSTKWPALDKPLTVTDETIEPENIKVRIYKPNDQNGSLPLMVYFHGGGFISGDLATEDPQCRIIAAKTPCVVVNVDYPLAPKVNIDQIIQSGLRSIEWAKSHSPPLTNSPQLLLAGGSAGATLALQLTYHYTQSSKQQANPLTGLILIMPTTSPSGLTPYNGPLSNIHKSSNEKAEGAPFLNRVGMQNMIKIPRMDVSSPNHFPLLASRLEGFPRTYIVTAEHDPTRDDGKVLARRLETESSAGVSEVCYMGLPHWFHWYPGLRVAREMMDRTVLGVQWVVGIREEVETGDVSIG